jgi:hypothetical protein
MPRGPKGEKRPAVNARAIPSIIVKKKASSSNARPPPLALPISFGRSRILFRCSTLAMSEKRSLGSASKHENSVWQTETLPN